MNKLLYKIGVGGLFAIVCSLFFGEYSTYFLLIYVGYVIYEIFSISKDFQRKFDSFTREYESEIKDIEGQKNLNYDILQKLIKTMVSPILFIDQDGIILYTNQTFRDTFKIKHLRGKQYKGLFDGELLEVVDRSYLLERKITSIIQVENRYYQVETSPLFKDEIVFNGAIILFTDVSQMKEMEQMQKQLFSDVSHELKTPMAAIIGSIEILQREGIKDEAVFHEFMNILLKESKRMERLINDILEMSKLQKTKVSLDLMFFDVEALVKETIELFDPIAKEKQLVLLYQNKLKEELLLDYASIKTILNNLISNAIRYSNEGVIIIETYFKDQMFVLSVQDEGIGISKDDLPFIYDRFFQVDRARSEKKGTGLGLSIVKRMIELNKGMIEVESELGIGSKFVVKVPSEMK